MTKERSLSRLRAVSLVGGVACGLAACAGAAASGGERFFRGYLFAFLFWLQLGTGSCAMLMITFLTGGEWSARMRRILEAASRTQLVLAFLFVPVLLGVRRIFPWTDGAVMAGDAALRHKAAYLNIPWFGARAAFYFLCWIVVSRVLDHLSQRQREETGLVYKARLRQLSAGGLVFYGFSVSFASIDWQMSLEPLWFSTIYGMIFGVSQLLGAWAFSLVVFCWIAVRAGGVEKLSEKILRDLGNILLTLIILWTYLSFMQYLIIWSGNLPEEVTWASSRVGHGWQWVALGIVLFQFAAPFFLLLFRPIKTHPRALGSVAGLVLVINVVDRLWQIMPPFQTSPELDWQVAASFVCVGGIWLWAFFGYLLQRPVSIAGEPHPATMGEEVPAHA